MGNHFREPDTSVQFTRRSILKSTPAIVTPLALAATQANAGEIDQEKHLDHLIDIALCTGLSMKDMVKWFDNVDLTQVAENVSNWRDGSIPDMKTGIPMERVHFYAGQLRREMQRQTGRSWRSCIDEDNGFILICS